MSSSIEVRLKRVGDSYKNALPLMWMTTTPTRVLRDEVYLLYCGGHSFLETDEEEEKVRASEYGYFAPLTEEKLSEIILFYDNTIIENQKQIKYYEDSIQKLQDMLVKASSGEVYDKIKDDIYNTSQSIIYLKEDLEDVIHYKNLWVYSVKYIFDFNFSRPYDDKESEFELIYYAD